MDVLLVNLGTFKGSPLLEHLVFFRMGPSSYCFVKI